MRISDWSSDVCSSDLVAADLQAERATHSPATQLIKPSNRSVYPGHCSQNSGGAQCGEQSEVKTIDRPAPYSPAATSGSPLMVAGKIGRASCRDRVCQYV